MEKSMRPSAKASVPKKRIFLQLENFKTMPNPKYGDSFHKVKSRFPGLLESLGLPSEQADIRAAVILSRCDMDINARNLALVKELDGKITKLMDSFHPKIAAGLIEAGRDPLETPIGELQAYIDSFGGKYGKTDAAGILRAISDIKPEMRQAIISLHKAFYIITRNDGEALGYAVNSGHDATLGELLHIASGVSRRMNYAVYDGQPIVMRESSIRTEIKRACAYGKTLLTN